MCGNDLPPEHGCMCLFEQRRLWRTVWEHNLTKIWLALDVLPIQMSGKEGSSANLLNACEGLLATKCGRLLDRVSQPFAQQLLQELLHLFYFERDG
jgi:hypothetical protein